MRWAHGSRLVERYVGARGVDAAVANLCVRDSGVELITYRPHGTMAWARAPAAAHNRAAIARGERRAPTRVMSPRIWRNHALVVRRTGQPFSVWWLWRDPSWQLIGGYVNLETSFLRSPVGVDTRDHVLDIVVTGPREWRIKDHDELHAHVGVGRYPPSWAARLETRAAAAVTAIERWQAPFDQGWERWRPPASWGPVALPVDWRRGLRPVGLH